MISNDSVLKNGVLTVTGRLIDASNATLLAHCEFEGVTLKCIYKPVAGERPLWDFPDGSLANREFAAFLVSEFLQLNLVPLTLLRDGPFGHGMVQEWIEIDPKIDLADYFSSDEIQLRSMVLFDAIINNTDRKIGHLLPREDGKLFGCDHGVTFHEEDKLRTVLWQWAGDSLTSQERVLLEQFSSDLKSGKYPEFETLITRSEKNALSMRVDKLLLENSFPMPNSDWPSVPWPAF
jgi:hypothetical protein